MSSHSISPPPKPVSTLEFPETLSSDGKTLSSLKYGEPSQEIRDISAGMSNPTTDFQTPLQKQKKNQNPQPTPAHLQPIRESVTAEFQPEPKQMTLQGKLKSCKKSSLRLELLRTLPAELTSKEKVFSAYSKKQLKEISAQLWFPIETDLQGSDSSSSNGCLSSIESNSWYSNRALEVKNQSYARTCFPLSTSFPVELTGQDDTRKGKQMKSLKRPKIRFVKCCEWAIVKSIEGIKYARPCGNVLKKGERVCPKHKGMKEKEFEQYWPYCCQSILKKLGTGIEKERSKKDLKCGEFCKEGDLYCKIHMKNATKPVNPTLRCIKVRARPNALHNKEFEKIFGDARKTYNLMVEERLEDQLNGVTDVINKTKLEGEYKKKHVTNCSEYLKQTPKAIRAGAVEEYFTGVVNALNMYDRKVNTENWKRENWDGYTPKEIKLPVIQFKSKRDQQCINLPLASTSIVNIPSNDSSKNSSVRPRIGIKIFPRFLSGPIPLDRRALRNKTLQSILKTGIQYDYKLIRTKSNKYYFCFPYPAKIIPNVSTKQAACDPGVRTFQTVYSPQGDLLEFGKDSNQVIRLYHDTIKTLKTQYFKGFNRFNHRLRKSRLLLQDKLKNMVNDLHYKTANILCSSYGTVILPKFAVRQMVAKEDTCHTTKREMLTLAHSTFRRRLISKAEILNCTILVPANEFKTTMTCGICFTENRNVGVSKVFRCDNCKLIAGRDVNAPRCIFIRQLKLC